MRAQECLKERCRARLRKMTRRMKSTRRKPLLCSWLNSMASFRKPQRSPPYLPRRMRWEETYPSQSTNRCLECRIIKTISIRATRGGWVKIKIYSPSSIASRQNRHFIGKSMRNSPTANLVGNVHVKVCHRQHRGWRKINNIVKVLSA